MLQPDGNQITSESADELAATADHLAISEGVNDRTTAAIQEAVQAARAVLSRDGSRESRRRLSRTLWRQAAGLATAGQIQEAVGPAREAIELARQAVRETRPDDPALDAVCGEFGLRVVDLSQVLGAAGHGEEAQRLITESAEVTRRGGGPLSARARAGVMLTMVGGLVDEAVRSMSAGRQPLGDPAFVIGAAETLVRDLRAISTEDDPTTIFDLAQGLHVLGRACLIVGRPEQAIGALSEALAIFGRFDGLAAQGKAQEVREELERVNQIMSRPAAPGRNADPAAGGGRRWWGKKAAASGSASPAEPPDPLAAADRWLAEGKRLVQVGRLSEAEKLLGKAVAQFAALSAGENDTSPPNLAIRRKLALAHWRYAMVAFAAGQIETALTAGGEGTEVGLELLRHLQSGTPEHSEVTAETMTALTDLAEYACRAGRFVEGLGLLDSAAGLAGTDENPAVRRALGTALHNQVANMLSVLTASAQRNAPFPFTLESVTPVMTRALAIRAELVGTDVLARWELASSLLLHCKVLVLSQQAGEAIESLSRAAVLAREVGASAADLHAQAVSLAGLLQEVAPAEVRQARASGNWPFRLD